MLVCRVGNEEVARARVAAQAIPDRPGVLVTTASKKDIKAAASAIKAKIEIEEPTGADMAAGGFQAELVPGGNMLNGGSLRRAETTRSDYPLGLLQESAVHPAR